MMSHPPPSLCAALRPESAARLEEPCEAVEQSAGGARSRGLQVRHEAQCACTQRARIVSDRGQRQRFRPM